MSPLFGKKSEKRPLELPELPSLPAFPDIPRIQREERPEMTVSTPMFPEIPSQQSRPLFPTSTSLISEIAIMVQDYRAKITVAEEDNGQHAVMINFGRDTKRVTAEFVRNKLERISDVLQQIYVLLYDELECDIDWDVWWDTDEVMY